MVWPVRAADVRALQPAEAAAHVRVQLAALRLRAAVVPVHLGGVDRGMVGRTDPGGAGAGGAGGQPDGGIRSRGSTAATDPVVGATHRACALRGRPGGASVPRL